MPALAWRRLAAALAATVLSMAVLWTAVPPVYLTNDDVTIRLSVEGGLVPGQPPGGYALMTHSALGWAIALLSPVVSALPFWDLAVTGTLAFALAVLTALCWPILGRGWPARATALTALAVPLVPLLGSVQFTFSATAAGAAAGALAFVEMSSGDRRRPAVLAVAALLLAAGMLVRPMGGAAGAVAAAVLLSPLALSRRRLGALGAIALAALAAFAALQALDASIYALDPEWDRYHRYNWMLARLFEWGGLLATRDIDVMRAAAGWSENDWHMLAGWLGVDPDTHGFARVERAYQAYDGPRWEASLEMAAARVAAVAATSPRRLLTDSAHVLAAVAAAGAAYATSRGAALLLATVALFGLLGIGIEAAFKQLPFRLLAPLHLALGASALLTLGAHRRQPSPIVAVIGLSAVMAIAADRLIATGTQARANLANAAELERHMDDLMRLGPSLLVIHGDAFPSEVWWRPFQRRPRDPATIRLGDNNQNPLLQRYLTSTGRQPLLRAACDDPSLLVASVEGRLEPATKYLREHLGREVRWRPVYAGPFTAWRCERADQSQAPDTAADAAAKSNSQ